MNENELYIVKEYKFDSRLITEIESIKDKRFRDCHNSYFHNFKYEFSYDIKLTNITINETINMTISDKSMNLNEINKKLTVARQIGFMFNQINKVTINYFSHLRYINVNYYLKFPIPMCHRQFFGIISQNREYVDSFCNDRNNTFHFACRKWIKNCTYFFKFFFISNST